MFKHTHFSIINFLTKNGFFTFVVQKINILYYKIVNYFYCVTAGSNFKLGPPTPPTPETSSKQNPKTAHTKNHQKILIPPATTTRRRNSSNPNDESRASIRTSVSSSAVLINENSGALPFCRRIKRRNRNSSSVHFDLTPQSDSENDYHTPISGTPGSNCSPSPKYGSSPKFGSKSDSTLKFGSSPKSPNYNTSTPSNFKKSGKSNRRRSISEGHTTIPDNLHGMGDCAILDKIKEEHNNDQHPEAFGGGLKPATSYSSILSTDSHFYDDYYDEIEIESQVEDFEDYPAWKPTSKRWRARFESLAERPVSELRSIGDYMFCDSEVHLAISTSSPSHQSGVYLSLDSKGTEFCLKKMKMPKKSENREYINEQAEKLLKMNHKNVLKYFDYLQKKPNLFLITDLYMGNLRHWVCGLVNSAMSMKGNLVEKFVPNKMAWDLVAGLNYLKNSEFAMVHGNLTPQNILIGEKGHLVIADPLIFKQFRMQVQKVPKKVPKKDEKNKSRDKSGEKAKHFTKNSTESENEPPTEKKATLKSKKHIGECYNAKAWLAPELLKQFDKSSYAEEIPSFEGDVFSLGLILFYIYSYGEHAFAPEDSNFSSHEVRENIMNNNICLKTRFISDENKCQYKNADFQEAISFENIDVEERITMPRDKVLPGFCVTLLKWMLEHDVEKRALIEEVVDEFNGMNLIG